MKHIACIAWTTLLSLLFSICQAASHNPIGRTKSFRSFFLREIEQNSTMKNHSIVRYGSDLRLIKSRPLGIEKYGLMGQIPKMIWQTYKTKSLPKDAQKLQKTWFCLNPGYAYSLWDDNDIARYIHKKWNYDTECFFYALPLGVMKADLWRYLILTTEGGIYSDVDSKCCSSIDSWASDVTKKSKHVLLVGLENETHFCQWTIVATAQHPAMKHVCEFLVDNWKNKGIDIEDPNFVHATTGPGIWTDALIDYLKISLQDVPARKRARYVYDLYTQDASFRDHINKKGVYLFSQKFFAGQASKNMYGSSNFGDGYSRWTEERDTLIHQSLGNGLRF